MEVATKSRGTLAGYFVTGAVPTARQCADLIEAMLVAKDDGVTRPDGGPLRIEASRDAAKNALALFPDFATDPEWIVSLAPPGGQGACSGLGIGDHQGHCRLFIDETTGNLGIATTQPTEKLTVDGSVSASEVTTDGSLRMSRMGVGTAPPDPEEVADLAVAGGIKFADGSVLFTATQPTGAFETLQVEHLGIGAPPRDYQALTLGESGTGMRVGGNQSLTFLTRSIDRMSFLPDGGVRLGATPPVVYKTYPNQGEKPYIFTEFSADWVAMVAGISTTETDPELAQRHGITAWPYLDDPSQTWIIHCDFPGGPDHDGPHFDQWNVSVVFIRKELVTIQGSLLLLPPHTA